MTSIVESVSAVAVWGSLLASLIVGSFMAVQAFLDPGRRARFLLFSAVCFGTLTIDLIFPLVDKVSYELLRVIGWSFYGPAVALLLGCRWMMAASLVTATLSVGLLSWMVIDHNLATTCVLPLSFAIAAAAHGRYYTATRGYSSAVLTATSLCQSIQCSFFYSVVSLGEPAFNALGYLHYGSVTVAGVLLGWVHLPRELRGSMPVTVPPRTALLFCAPFVAAELSVFPVILLARSFSLEIAVAGCLAQLALLIAFFFYHRHLLVVFTDNVSALLAERTASLVEAQQELALQNERQAERLRAQAESLEQQSAVIERQRRLELAAQTAGQAAHDIQNLISPLVTYLDVLERRGTIEVDLPELARRIRNALHDLRELNGQLLTLARRGKMERAVFDVHELVQDLKERLEGVALEVVSVPSLLIEGSRSQLGRALTNLVMNGHEASEGRMITIRCLPVKAGERRRCHLGFLDPGHYVVVEVHDSGPGIPPEIVDRIFEPFFSSKSRSYSSGSGLGLSIVAAVVDDHGGVLDLSTGPKGTVFSLFLPVDAAASSYTRAA